MRRSLAWFPWAGPEWAYTVAASCAVRFPSKPVSIGVEAAAEISSPVSLPQTLLMGVRGSQTDAVCWLGDQGKNHPGTLVGLREGTCAMQVHTLFPVSHAAALMCIMFQIEAAVRNIALV